MEEVRTDTSFGHECVDTMGWTSTSVEEDRFPHGNTDDPENGEHPSITIHELSLLFGEAA